MKFKITKEEFEKLTPEVQSEYEQKGETYRLKLEDYEDDMTPELRRAKEREALARKEAEKEARELREKLEQLEGNDARKRGDIESIEKSWKEKLAAVETSNQTEIGKLKSTLERTLVSDVAQSLASKLAGQSAALLLPHIRERLRADFEVDPPITRVLVDGKPSALTIADLEKEFRAKPEFAVIIVGSNASGSGARGGMGGGATKKISEMDGEERTALYKENPERFNQMVAAEKAAKH